MKTKRELFEELQVVRKKLLTCKSRIENTKSFKTEAKIIKEKEKLELERDDLERRLKL
jgi:hypothetical protein